MKISCGQSHLNASETVNQEIVYTGGLLHIAYSGGSRNKERGRCTQQVLLIIHKNTPFRAFSVIISHARVQSTTADCSGMVCSGLSAFGNSIVRLATVTGVSSVSSERGGARQARHYMDPPLAYNTSIVQNH